MDISIERLCIANGLKMTGPRRVIARVLSEATDHPDVDELHRRANALDNRISLATVYRTVRLLEAKGILERRDLGSRRARYEPSGDGHHFHLIDRESGKVLEFSAPEAEILLREIAARHGFDVALIKIELFGHRLTGGASGGAALNSVDVESGMP
jgi:Fur family ferric uptake transcriptional regulator